MKKKEKRVDVKTVKKNVSITVPFLLPKKNIYIKRKIFTKIFASEKYNIFICTH
ncbi:hypothetical protein EZS27_004529 [termite gut metagenome]|uniref:Uncharacterized protein n=1 Tax=termite gut metagenome TaxID=433724 RepID=A0A5J4SPY5_9ZZZZ